MTYRIKHKPSNSWMTVSAGSQEALNAYTTLRLEEKGWKREDCDITIFNWEATTNEK